MKTAKMICCAARERGASSIMASTMTLTPGSPITRDQAQALALSEAENGTGFVSPNPLVGCVIVDHEHRFLASGYHARVGGDHAEIDAIKKVPAGKLKNATMYVTLEPCSHQGRTPPCADRVVSESIKAVVVGVQDPNPLVSGKGLERLRNAGIQVEVDPKFAAKSERLAEVFLWNMRHQSPFVALKVATSLDGQMALKSGESQWITSEESRVKARALRAKYDATLIGARTLIHDDPMLDFRGTSFADQKKNRIVIWDPSQKAASFLAKSQLAKVHAPENISILTAPNLDADVLKGLFQQGIRSLFVEGGSHTLSQLIQQRLFQKIYQFVGPSLMGGGMGWSSGLTVNNMKERIELSFTAVEPIGGDVLITAIPKN